MTMEPHKEMGKTNLLIDALRGLCFVLMTADHLPENLLARFSNGTYGPFGFFTAASGFVFLSAWSQALCTTDIGSYIALGL